MKLKTVILLSAVFNFQSVMAQTLPDEINYSPYLTRLQTQQNILQQERTNLASLEYELENLETYLREASQFITKTEGEISSYQAQISENRQTIPRLQAQVTQLRNFISQTERNIQQINNELNRLRQQDSQLSSQISRLEMQINPRLNQIRQFERELATLQNEESQVQRSLSQAQTQVRTHEANIQKEVSQQQSLNRELSAVQTNINNFNNQINSTNSQISQSQSSLRLEESKLESLNKRVEQAQSELQRLRSQGGTPEEIKKAEQLLRAVTQTRDNTKNEISSIQNNIRKLQANITELQRKITQEENKTRTIPVQISQSQSRQRDAENALRTAQQLVRTRSSELIIAQKRVENKKDTINVLLRDVSRDQNQLAQLKSQRDQILSGINQANRDISTSRNEITAAQRDISSLQTEERERQADIPRFESAIRSAQNEITSTRSEMRSVEAKIPNIERSISQAQNRVSQNAQLESELRQSYQSRYSLYHEHLSAAQELGSSQSGQATVLGRTDGEAFAKTQGTQVGKSTGSELGLSEGKYWASVRGEIQGFDNGYRSGLNSSADILEATSKGSEAAKLAALNYAQTVYKPRFFENFYQLELKKEVANKNLEMNLSPLEEETENFISGIEDLSPAELAEAQSIKTSLDSLQAQFSVEVDSLKKKYQSIRNPAQNYSSPSKIPTLSAQCSNVYKKLAVFTQACQEAFQTQYKQLYITAHKESFISNFTGFFEDNFMIQRELNQTNSYDKNFSSFYKTAQNEGLVIGKKEIYEKKFTESYNAVYKTQLPLEEKNAQNEAKEEVKDWVSKNAAITLSKAQILNSQIKAGEMAQVGLTLKNVSSQDYSGAIILKVKGNENAIISQKEFVIHSMPANKNMQFNEIKFSLNPAGISGSKAIVEIEARLPGTKYQAERFETIKVEQMLPVNPKMDKNLSVNLKPDIRRFLRTQKHSLIYSITPVVEDIKDGYEVSFEVLEGEKYISAKNSTKKTGAIKKGATGKASWTYTFTKTAENKTIVIKLQTKHLGVVLDEEIITLKPQ